MNFIFAKLFDVYKKKPDDSAESNISYYIGMNYLVILVSFFLLISKVIEKKYSLDLVAFTEFVFMICVMVAFAGCVYIAKFRYIKRRLIFALADKYKSRKMHVSLVYVLAVVIPITILFGTFALITLLTGGWMFDHHYLGVF